MNAHTMVFVLGLGVALIPGVSALANAQDQKGTDRVVVAQSNVATYHAQLDRLRAAIGDGDQAKVNHEVVTLLGILEERPMSAPDHFASNGTSLTDDMMRQISIQDERSGNSF